MSNKTVYTLDEIRQRIMPVAIKHGLPEVYVFGSYARGEATGESDVDLLIDSSQLRGFFAIGGVFADFEEALDKEIDLVTIKALESSEDIKFVNNVTNERVLVYKNDGERLEYDSPYSAAL